jgi:hypothetical protein
MNKKASLSLSIESVVILILAIAMLGMGIAFTKKMFDKFGNTLEIPPPELAASEDNPIVLSSDDIVVKKDKKIIIPVRFYSTFSTGNYHPTLPKYTIYPVLICNWAYFSGGGISGSAPSLQGISNYYQWGGHGLNGGYSPPAEKDKAIFQTHNYIGEALTLKPGEQKTFYLNLDQTFMVNNNYLTCTLKFKVQGYPCTCGNGVHLTDNDLSLADCCPGGVGGNHLIAEKQISLRVE